MLQSQLTDPACNFTPWKLNYSPLTPACHHLWITGSIRLEPHPFTHPSRHSLGYPPQSLAPFIPISLTPYLILTFGHCTQALDIDHLFPLFQCLCVGDSYYVPTLPFPCIQSLLKIIFRVSIESAFGSTPTYRPFGLDRFSVQFLHNLSFIAVFSFMNSFLTATFPLRPFLKPLQ